MKWTPFKLYVKGLHLSSKTVLLRKRFSLKHLSMATGCFWNYCGQSLAGLSLFTEVDTGYQKKSLVKTLLNIFLIVKQNDQMCEHQKIFSTILKSKTFQHKKIWVYSKPFIKIIGSLLLIVRFFQKVQIRLLFKS